MSMTDWTPAKPEFAPPRARGTSPKRPREASTFSPSDTPKRHRPALLACSLDSGLAKLLAEGPGDDRFETPVQAKRMSQTPPPPPRKTRPEKYDFDDSVDVMPRCLFESTSTLGSRAALPAESPLFDAVRAAVTQVTGVTPFVNAMHTSSDIRVPMVQKGIPTVGLGPLCGDLSQNGSHDEWVDVEDYLRAIAVAADSALRWCGAVRV